LAEQHGKRQTPTPTGSELEYPRHHRIVVSWCAEPQLHPEHRCRLEASSDAERYLVDGIVDGDIDTEQREQVPLAMAESASSPPSPRVSTVSPIRWHTVQSSASRSDRRGPMVSTALDTREVDACEVDDVAVVDGDGLQRSR